MSFCIKPGCDSDQCVLLSHYRTHAVALTGYTRNKDAVMSMIDARGPLGQDEYDLQYLAHEQELLSGILDIEQTYLYQNACAQCPYVPASLIES